MTVREANETDLAALAELERAAFSSDPWSEAALAGQLADPLCLTLLSEEEGLVTGYIAGRRLPPEAELYRVAVLSDRRGRGIGKALLSAFLNRLAACGCPSVFLEVREGNTAARTLYEHSGFHDAGRRRLYYRDPREDAVLYAKTEEDPPC